MTFGEKIKILRTDKGITQEDLAEKLYVSRTAVSKWEAGRGYPNIESLKAIARFFSVTVDDLLSSEEILTVAEEDKRQTERSFRDLIFGLTDICLSLLLFLPVFAEKTDDTIRGASLIGLGGIELYLKIVYLVVVIGAVGIGVLTLALQNSNSVLWSKLKTKISLTLGMTAVILFMISLQAYAAVFAFSLLVIKTFTLIKRA